LAIWPLRRLTSSTTAKWSWRKYELARARHLSEAHAALQVREVFQELGMQGNTLDKACAHVGASDETLMSFMKVRHRRPGVASSHAMRLRLSSSAAVTRT
jgi:hypothetical protein